MTAKVVVSGCFDMLHSGHIEFFQQAAAYGDLTVALGSDRTVFELKGRAPINTEDERLFMVKSVACVKDAIISRGSGYLDFADDLTEIHPDYFIVNEDGDTLEKRRLCERLSINYVVLRRNAHPGLILRSTSALRQIDQMPYRVDLAGGWLDQPFVSKHFPGSVITMSIEPTIEFNERSGMATSTRRVATQLWGNRLPTEEHQKLGYILFCCDNPPGTTEISGSQDSIGITFPGLARSDYRGEYWPHHIEHVTKESSLRFVEELLYLIPLGPRHRVFDVLGDTRIDSSSAKALAIAADDCWQAILDEDVHAFGDSFRRSFEAQIAMFPRMVTDDVTHLLDVYRELALGWKLSGAGGGGYLILVSDRPISAGVRIVARRAF
ncbi:MAG: adenylyltransferase/cytidyltransferase family protein [Caldilineales bacterium]|nr:adenylyltransferase/cytidyltransferase family protein [Caldilineales bacterium]